MGNCIPTLRCKHGNKVRDVWLDEMATEKTKDQPRETVGKKTGTRRCIKITLTRKQLEMLLKNAEGVSFKLPETCGSGEQKWKPSLQTILEHTVSKEKDLRPYVDQQSQKDTLLALKPSPTKGKMEIQARLKEYKLHFMVAIIMSVLVSALVYAAPRILDILAYFWPLFASTAAFLAVAITFGGFQQLSEETTGEGIMEYVAGRPDDSHKYD
ncbi:unnamed protein product [Brassica rapa]|uniref:Uncharacterized protein n=1 Tax=Brassica campestris TaxID=3711 RepID=A0A3P6BRS9_BRACM|nr:unnamed protein product [Brassica rapa]VDD03804.1 unnamed protein product [Brassica rapa]